MKTILIAEDEQTFRDILSKKLTSKGYVVKTAKNGKEALSALSSSEINLILLDLVMPEMDGQTFLYELQKGPYAHIPVIVLTNLSSSSTPSSVKKVLIKSNTSLENLVIEIQEVLPR